MSALSDHLLVIAILTYLVAMLAYGGEFAFGQRGMIARAAVRQRARELVGAGAPVAESEVEFIHPISVPPAEFVQPISGPPAEFVHPISVPPAPPGGLPGAARFAPLSGRIAVILTFLALAVHVACLVTRGFAAHRVPWGNMYEFVLAVCLVGAVAWLVLALRRPALRPMGLFVAMVLVLLLSADGMLLYTPVGPLVPALDSYWLKLHVTVAATATGSLLVGFVAAVLTLVRMGYDSGRRFFPFSLGDRLAGAQALERLTFRVHAFAFPIWTFAIILGAIWAESAWGKYWGWDPKETASFVAWVIYAAYLHARATPSVKRQVVTWIAVLGWVAMLVNLFVINIFVSGLHSYANIQ